MNDLKVVADEILPVYETNKGNKVVNARELHEQLMVGKKFATWIQDRINKYGFIKGDDFFPILGQTHNGRPKQEYLLLMDTAKEIAMVENNEQGRAIRKYFIEVEKKSRQITKPQSQLEILQGTINQLVEQDKRVTQLENSVSNISNIVSITSVGWRNKVEVILKKIAQKWTGIEPYRSVRSLSYDRFEKRAGCNLNIRLNNRKERAAAQGMPKSYVNKINRLDVIQEEKRLVEIYIQVVKEMALEFRVDINDFQMEEVM
ncbi:antA/AntB antirepressor family protein [Terribacillus sp. JSM ZJ617]|uniref:antA/AntB antirepressor family protein n=1 Tax=Terribacillus sp. JSM ZJ617 TaxID=3342119 RepID=UPI0035A84080